MEKDDREPLQVGRMQFKITEKGSTHRDEEVVHREPRRKRETGLDSDEHEVNPDLEHFAVEVEQINKSGNSLRTVAHFSVSTVVGVFFAENIVEFCTNKEQSGKG